MFVLTQCKLREDRIVPVKGAAPITLEWAELRQKLAPSAEAQALINLRQMEKGAFIGLLKDKQTGQPRNFILKNFDRSDRVDWVIKKDTTFPDRLIEVFRVEAANWESSVTEATG